MGLAMSGSDALCVAHPYVLRRHDPQATYLNARFPHILESWCW